MIRASKNGGAGGAIALPIFSELGEKYYSAPRIFSDLFLGHKLISTHNMLYFPPDLPY